MHGLLKLVLYGIALVVGLALTAVTGGLGSLVGIALAGLFLAYDGFDYPLARRSAGFGASGPSCCAIPALTLGYGLGATAAVSDPVRRLRRLAFRRRGRHAGVHGRENRKVRAPGPEPGRKRKL